MLHETPGPSIQGNGAITMEEGSQTLNSISEITSLPKPAHPGQRLRRSGRNRSTTRDIRRPIPQPASLETTRLETIGGQWTPDLPRPTKALGPKRTLHHSTVPPTKRRARGGCRIATSAREDAKEPNNSTGPHDIGAWFNHNQPPGATTERIDQGHSTSMLVANVLAGHGMNGMTAANRTKSKQRGDPLTAQSSLAIETTTDPKRSMIPPQAGRTSASLPTTSDTDPAKVGARHFSLGSRDIATPAQPSTSTTVKAHNLGFSCNLGVATTSPITTLLSPAVAGSQEADTRGRDVQLPPVVPVVTSPNVVSCQEISSQPCVSRSRKRAQSHAAILPPPKNRVQKPGSTVTPRHLKPVLVPTKGMCNPAPRSPTSTPATQAKQPRSASAYEGPYKKTEQPTLMRYEQDGFTGQLKRRYYKPHKEVKLEPARKLELKDDYYPAPERPSLAEMVARQEKMYNEVKWDTPELRHEYNGPKGIMDGLRGFETEQEVNAYFDRIEMEGPDLSYAPMRMPRQNVLQSQPHVCYRCVGGMEQQKIHQYWCECEDYCGDPVGEYDGAVIRPVKEKKEKAKVKKRWW